MLVLDSRDPVDVSLRNKPPLWGIGVTPIAITAAGPTAASASVTTAPRDSRELPSWGSSFGLLASLGGHVQVHYAVKVRKLQTVDQMAF